MAETKTAPPGFVRLRPGTVRKDRGPSAPPESTELAMRDQGMGPVAPFSPGRPINPYERLGRPPKGWDYPAGYNIATRPGRTRTKASFDTLRALIDAWDIAQMCIAHRIDDMRSFDWDIVPAAGVADNDVDAEITTAKAIMARPDGRLGFEAWQSMFMEDILRYDAGCLYRRRDMAGRHIALEVVDGTTIAPLIDYWGRTPLGDALAYTQFAHGLPWVPLRNSDLIYEPFRPQPDSPYGRAPIEGLLLTGNTDIRFQWYFLQYFTEGSIPGGFMEAPGEVTTPAQIEDWQAAWDAVMEGAQEIKHKIKWVPAGSNFHQVAPSDFKEEFPLFLMHKCCAMFAITPSDLGFTDDVNRAASETQVDIQFRIGSKPMARHLSRIYTQYLQEDRGLRVEFQFDLGQEKEDRLAVANTWKVMVEAGAVGVDEMRKELTGLPIDTERPVPRFIMTSKGVTPLISLYSIAGMIDPATLGPSEVAPIAPVHFGDGALGMVPTKAPGEVSFTEAPLNPDDPNFPANEYERPGSDVVAPTPPQPTLAATPVQASLAPVTKAIATVGPWEHFGDPLAGYWGPKLMAALGRLNTSLAQAAIALVANRVTKAVNPNELDAAQKAALEAELASTAKPDPSELIGILRSAYADAYLAGTHSAASRLGGPATVTPAMVSVDDAIDWSNWTPGSQAAAAQAALSDFGALTGVADQADGIIQTARDRLVTILATGLANGDSVGTISTAMNEVVNDPDRAATIANTTVAQAMGTSTLDTFKANNVTGKTWLTSNPCDICQANEDAGIIDLDEGFPSGDDAPPAHPNCRCALASAQLDDSGGDDASGDEEDDEE